MGRKMNYADTLTQNELYAMLNCMLVQGKFLSGVLNAEDGILLTCDPSLGEDLSSALVKVKNRISVKQSKEISKLMSILSEELRL